MPLGEDASRGFRWSVGLYDALAGACLFGALFLFTMTAALGSAGTLVVLGFASVAFVRGFLAVCHVGQGSEGIGGNHYGCVSFGAYAWGRAGR